MNEQEMMRLLEDMKILCQDAKLQLMELVKIKTAAEEWERIRLPDDSPRGKLFHPDFVAYEILNGRGPDAGL